MNRIRLVVSLIGLVSAVVGVVRDDRRMVWVAIGALSISVLLRFIGRRAGR